VVAVHLRREADDLVLSVRDWGRGTPAAEATEARGLGMKLIASLARQVGATVSRQKGPGTGFELRLPSV
jgi:two-component sensor histidine kinase